MGMSENEIARIIVDASLYIHTRLGPGLLESAYGAVLSCELGRRGLSVDRQVPLSLVWEGMLVEEGFRADLIVENKVLVELKSVERMLPVHKKQVITYLKVTGLRLGLLLNFGAPLMRDGIVRLANNMPE